ncbi:MAG: 3-hydroxy-5-phosphonooxypentane-2,4-dione thiolase [Deltaproteobacteria bacterium]|nr:3-hydroxy-5-phosphonooxypentane-2,4-dione thiolase [Deltaproteobacteria bacterium]
MDWGLQNRIAQIIKPDTGHTVMLAVDHGYFQGPTTGLEEPGKTIEPLLPYADALMPTRGVLRECVNPDTQTTIVLRVSGGNTMARVDELSDEIITTSIEDAVSLNVAAVAVSVYVGSAHQKQTLQNLSDVVNEAVKYGMPVLAVTAVGKDMVRDVRYLSLSCRVAAELGANMVKTYYCEGFEDVVKGCPVPIVMAGGKKIPEKDALTLTRNAIQGGAKGVDMGRNIFQNENPVAMIQAVRAVVHEGKSVKEAYQLYEEIAKG